LWADIFRVHGDGEYMRWERVSDDVVPVNISCIEDTPSTVFQVTAYNRQVEKIFDVKIYQPGTVICPATDCFVHWRDAASHCEWGLNFSTSTDAQKFRDCCSFPTQRFARKASSASSLRLSPPKVRFSGVRINNRLSTNSPSKTGSQNGSGVRRTQSPPPDYALIHRRKPQAADDSSVTVVSTSNSTNPAFRRSFPSGRRVESSSTGISPLSVTSKIKAAGQKHATVAPSEPIFQTSSIKSESIPSGGSITTSRTGGVLKYVDHGVRPASAISDMANQKSSSPKHVQISDIVSVNITDISSSCVPPTIINTSMDKPNGILKRDNSVRSDKIVQPEQSLLQTFAVGHQLETVCETTPTTSSPPPLPEEPVVKHPKATLRVDTSITTPQSRNTSSSESPEWPSPPEPLTPQTPQTPNAPGQISFDSDTIQKMLRSLPSSPMDSDFPDDADLGFHEEYSASDDSHTKHPQNDQQLQLPRQNGRRGNRLSRTKSLTVHDRNTKANSNPRRQQSMDTPEASGARHKVETTRPRRFNKIALERELKKRNKIIAANYPDSGLGVSTDTSSSIRYESNSAFTKTGKSLCCCCLRT
ncbi:unnamed protein product, partial [Candidula unifasciata]